MKLILLLLFLISCHAFEVVEFEIIQKYLPNWDSLDSRPLPPWFDQAKVGIFIHWGVFSVPSFNTEWFWAYWKDNETESVEFMKRNYPPDFTYQEFAKDFTTEFFNASEWADLFKKAGAKYVVLTSKHHEGYSLWPSKYSFGWNSKDLGPHRDLVGELAEAIRNENLTFGLYHSLYEWFHPLYLNDKKNNFTSDNFVTNKMLPEMIELINNYSPEVFWSDGDWEANDTYFKSLDFLAWLYNDSPVRETVVVNDRWGIGIPCKHGDFYSCKDRYNPGVLQDHKWENAMTLDKLSWGFRRNAKSTDYLTIHELLTTLIQTVSCGGNILINIGPAKDGTIPAIFQERLLQLGEWLDVNGEAIYGSVPWTYQNDTLTEAVWFTQKPDLAVYATVLNWPKGDILILEAVSNLFSKKTQVELLEQHKKLEWEAINDRIYITFPNKAKVINNDAWVIKIY